MTETVEELDLGLVGDDWNDDVDIEDEQTGEAVKEKGYLSLLLTYSCIVSSCVFYCLVFFLGGDWDVEDVDITKELEDTAVIGDDGYFVPPTRGVSVPQKWTNNSLLVHDHVMAGSFESAGAHLQEQIGVVNIGPFKQLFLAAYARSHLSFSALPNMPSLYVYPSRKDAKVLPAVGVKISDLSQDKLKVTSCVKHVFESRTAVNCSDLVYLQHCYELTTQGKFNEALDKFRSLLLNIPIIVVDSKAEIEEAKHLIAKSREYILGTLLTPAFSLL